MLLLLQCQLCLYIQDLLRCCIVWGGRAKEGGTGGDRISSYSPAAFWYWTERVAGGPPSLLSSSTRRGSSAVSLARTAVSSSTHAHLWSACNGASSAALSPQSFENIQPSDTIRFLSNCFFFTPRARKCWMARQLRTGRTAVELSPCCLIRERFVWTVRRFLFLSSFSVCLFFCAYGREQVKTEGAITVEVKKRKKKKLNNSLGNICKEGRKDVRNQELRVGWNSDRRQLDLGIYSG